MITPGSQTIAVPIPGTIDMTAATVPQKMALGNPTVAKAAPTSAPWTRPITAMPFNVARVTEVNLSSIRSSSSGFSGRKCRIRPRMCSPSTRKKNMV